MARSRTRCRCILGLASLLTAGVCFADLQEQGPRNSPPSGLQAGVARASITPAVGIPHMNWGSATHIFAEGIDPVGMYATALVVSDGKQKFAIVDLDALFPQPYSPAIALASRKTGIPEAHIRFGASHTHAGPSLSAKARRCSWP